MKRILQHARANLIAYLALFVALGGTSYAAFTLPANSVGTRQLKNHSVTPIKFDRRTVGAYVRAWAVIQPGGAGERVASSRPPARVVGWDPAFDSGMVEWSEGVSSRCLPMASTPAGFVSVRLLPRHRRNATLQFEPFSNTGEHTTGDIYVAVLCPGP